MKKAVIYCRASVQDDIPIVAQRRACDIYCHQHGFIVDKAFADTDAPTLPVDQPALKIYSSTAARTRGASPSFLLAPRTASRAWFLIGWGQRWLSMSSASVSRRSMAVLIWNPKLG